MTHYQRRKTHEKETTKGTADPCRHTAYIFIAAPSHFSTAFAGVKSIFLTIGGQQSVTWNSFLDITALLLITTILFGRHFCGYACAFGSLGDALYELTAFIRAKCFGKKEKTWISGGMCTQIAESKICTPCVPASFLHDRILF